MVPAILIQCLVGNGRVLSQPSTCMPVRHGWPLAREPARSKSRVLRFPIVGLGDDDIRPVSYSVLRDK